MQPLLLCSCLRFLGSPDCVEYGSGCLHPIQRLTKKAVRVHKAGDSGGTRVHKAAGGYCQLKRLDYGDRQAVGED